MKSGKSMSYAVRLDTSSELSAENPSSHFSLANVLQEPQSGAEITVSKTSLCIHVLDSQATLVA